MTTPPAMAPRNKAAGSPASERMAANATDRPSSAPHCGAGLILAKLIAVGEGNNRLLRRKSFLPLLGRRFRLRLPVRFCPYERLLPYADERRPLFQAGRPYR